ncbi:YHYH protein [Verrucomicrobiaceae bacterium 227]
MTTSLAILSAFSLALIPSLKADNLSQNLASWHTASAGSYARIFETAADENAGNSVTTWNRGQGIQAQATYAGVHEISYDTTSVYVRTTGLGTHLMGPWYLNAANTNLFPNYPDNQAIIYRIPRDPGTPPVTKSLTGLGRIGIFVDGVSMFDSRDAFSYDTSAAQDDGPNAAGVNGDGVWNRDAFVNESVTFDAANAHQAGSNYHYHANPPGLRHQLGDSVDYDPATNRYTENFNGAHSPILAWTNDGYPLYGPYGYSDPNDPESAIRRMTSGFRKRTITQRQTLPAFAQRDQNRAEALPVNRYGPAVSAQFPLGHYLEDYEYLGDFGLTHGTDFDLNEHNGRFCVTPEFPGGTFAYFVSIEPDGTPAFPYNIGRNYFGTPTGGVTNAVPANATINFEGGPERPLESQISVANDEVTVTWSTLEGGSYFVDSSSDLDTWQAAPALQKANQLSITEPTSDDQKFFRAEFLGLAPFDDAGFVYNEIAAPGPNNILLIIVDDWGIDFSALDNPTGPALPPMPTWESLADQGVRFTNAYAQPTCSPTRAGILSGRYSFRHGIGSPAGASFPSAEVSLPEAFANAASPYALSSIGKWHLGGGDDGPFALAGWESFQGALTAEVEDFYDWNKTINGITNPVTDTYATSDQVTDAVTFIQAQNDNPWFCWLAFNAPHTPFHEPPSELLPSDPAGNSNTARFMKALEAMDTELARLLESVDLTKTNVFLIGDNGTPGNIAQTPFIQGRAKGTLYEGGIRVPFIALGPDVRTRGTRDDLVHCADLFATILDLANLPLPDTTLDGRSLLPALTGSGTIEGGVVLENFGNAVTDPGRAIRISDYKLHLYDDGREELYNVATDLSEGSNLLLGTLTAEEQAAYDGLLARNEELAPDAGGTDATGILSVSPTSATAGATVTITINLDPNKTDPVVPPIGGPTINTITLGGISGTNITRPSNYVAEATFVLPTTPGSYAIELIFNGPQARTFGLNNAFEVQ